ncbi:MAG: TIGR02147 family protein [Bacteriovoracaceae bacterium]
MEKQIQTTSNFRLWLQSELTDRCRKNSRYSLRSFALLLDIEPSSLSKILAGKRKPTPKVITKICERLSVGPTLTDKFLKTSREKKTHTSNTDQNFELIAEDTFVYISNWYYAAILELTFTDEIKDDPQYISSALGITVTEAKIAIERLLRLGLLSKEASVLKKTSAHITNFTPGFTSSANKEFQRQILKKALEAIDLVNGPDKDITSMTMAIDVDKLPEARKIIAQFRRDMCAFLEDGEQTRVYNLGIQLYPISKNINKDQA